MRILTIAAGLLNAGFVAFHVFLGFQIAHWPGLLPVYCGLFQTFNLCCSLMLAFLAFALLVRGKEVMGTGLGGAALALGTLVYLSRAAAEFIWLNESIMITIACTVMGLLHAVLFTGVRVTRPVT